MKCENCGKNDVSFEYVSIVNGKREEKHLCAECAQKLGYTRSVSRQTSKLFKSMFQDDPFFGRSLLSDDFGTFPSLFGRMEHLMDSPFDDFFAEIPALGTVQDAPVQETKPAEEEKKEVQESRFAYLRRLNAKKMEMKRAIHEENFERAAELRDEIHEMEQKHKEGNASA